jgi:integrase
MARPLRLKARRDPSNGKWRVNVIERLSPSGRRERRFFDTLQAANAYIEELKSRRDNLAALPGFSPVQLLDAAAALELLSEEHPNATLLQAVRSFIATERQARASVTLAELFDSFRAARATKSASYRRDIRWATDRMRPFMAFAACDIGRSHIGQALEGLPPSSRNNVLRALRAVFRYGHDLGYLKELPVRRNDFATIKRQELSILSVGKIRALLEAALDHDPELLPLLLVETFCGVRPAEACRLLWSDIDLLKARVTIRAAISKTGTARPIQLAPCALAWFEKCGKPRELPNAIAPWPESILRSRLRKVRYLAGYRGAGAYWTPGALRDAFCSYHLAHYGLIDRLIQEAGHTDLRTTKDHYLGLVSAEAAAEFWNLLPPGHREKVVQFETD